MPVENAELVDAHLVPRLVALVDAADAEDSKVAVEAIEAALKAEAEAFGPPAPSDN